MFSSQNIELSVREMWLTKNKLQVYNIAFFWNQVKMKAKIVQEDGLEKDRTSLCCFASFIL